MSFLEVVKNRFNRKTFSLIGGVLLFAVLLFIIIDGINLKLEISKETTFFTEPLKEDGTVDYIKALNNYRKPEGLTPENNAAVDFWRAYEWPLDVYGKHDEAYMTAICKEFGIPLLPKEEKILVGYEDFYKEKHNVSDFPDQLSESLRSYYDCGKKPWVASDYPEVKEWLDQNAVPLKHIENGLAKPFCYFPYVNEKDETNVVLGMDNPEDEMKEDIADLLKVRAMLHLGNGDTEKAIVDLLRLYTLAHMAADKEMLVERLTGCRIESRAYRGWKQVIYQGKLSAKQALAFHEKLSNLRDSFNLEETIDVFCRSEGLDTLISTLTRASEEGGKKFLGGCSPLASYDRTMAAKRLNGWYDKIVACTKLPYYEREDAYDKVDLELKKLQESVGEMTSENAAKLFWRGHQYRTKWMTDHITLMVMPNYNGISYTYETAYTRRDLLQVAMLLIAYKAEHKSYPKSLDQLASQYAAKIPLDRFTGKPLVYRLEGDEFLLYSFSRNGRDDDGDNAWTGDYDEKNRRKDDHFIRSALK